MEEQNDPIAKFKIKNFVVFIYDKNSIFEVWIKEGEQEIFFEHYVLKSIAFKKAVDIIIKKELTND